MAEILDITKRLIQKAQSESPFAKIMGKLTKEEADYAVKQILDFAVIGLLDEIRDGLDGKLDYKSAPFFGMVDQEYDARKVRGCYFCDRSIDGNAVPFVIGKTKVCLTCQIKMMSYLASGATRANAKATEWTCTKCGYHHYYNWDTCQVCGWRRGVELNAKDKP
jgi:ribosomal protein L24E